MANKRNKRVMTSNPFGTYMDKGGKVKTREEKYAEAYGDTPNYKKKEKKVYSPLKGKRKEGGKKFSGSPYNIVKLKPGDKGYKSAEQLNKEVRAIDSKKKKADPSDKWDVRKAVKQAHALNPPKKKMETPSAKPIRRTTTKPDIKKVESKKMKPVKKESRWSKLKSKFKAKKVKPLKDKKRNIVNIKKMQDDTPTGIKKKKISDWQGKKTKLTAKQKKAKADAYKSPMTGVEKAAAKKKGITKADQYSPVDQSKGVSKAKTVTRKDTTVKTKGGDYPKYRKDTTSSKSFSKTFAQNRKAGKKSFTWQGRSYSTRKAGEGKSFDATTGKWGKAKKMQMGGMVDTPETQAFKQGIKYFKGGGKVSTSNDNAGAGDIAHVHSHSGYKAGE